MNEFLWLIAKILNVVIWSKNKRLDLHSHTRTQDTHDRLKNQEKQTKNFLWKISKSTKKKRNKSNKEHVDIVETDAMRLILHPIFGTDGRTHGRLVDSVSRCFSVETKGEVCLNESSSSSSSSSCSWTMSARSWWMGRTRVFFARWTLAFRQTSLYTKRRNKKLKGVRSHPLCWG